MAAKVTRSGQSQVLLGVIGSGASVGDTLDLGYIEMDVLSEDPLELTDDDLKLVEATVQDAGGGMACVGGSQSHRAVKPVVYTNELGQNYPNPFNPSTTIAYSLANKTDVKLQIFDVRGRLVKTLVDGERSPNNYRVMWDGRNNSGNSVASGIYFYRLVAGEFKATKKMVLLR